MNKYKLVNLTENDIVIFLYGTEEREITIPKFGLVARVGEVSPIVTQDEKINGIPTRRVKYSIPINLPAPEKNTIFIVDPLVRDVAKREDVVSVDEAWGACKNEKRQITAYKALVRHNRGEKVVQDHRVGLLARLFLDYISGNIRPEDGQILRDVGDNTQNEEARMCVYRLSGWFESRFAVLDEGAWATRFRDLVSVFHNYVRGDLQEHDADVMVSLLSQVGDKESNYEWLSKIYSAIEKQLSKMPGENEDQGADVNWHSQVDRLARAFKGSSAFTAEDEAILRNWDGHSKVAQEMLGTLAFLAESLKKYK